jgi:NTP pyrophosphatase (non-canonical NTP hydrolase)
MFLNFAASKKKPVDDLTGIGDISEIDDALIDLEQGEAIGRKGRNSEYWPKIRERLLAASSSDNIDEAIREWESNGLPFISSGTCELCDKTPIKYHFPIRNRTSGNKFIVGCECIYHYLEIGGYEAPAAIMKKLNAQKAILKKMDKGEVDESDLAILSKVDAIETYLRRVIAALAGGSGDLDIVEYSEALFEVIFICNTLGIKNSSSKVGSDAYVIAKKIEKKMKAVRAKQKFQGNGLGALTSAIMSKRKLDEKYEILTDYFDMVTDLSNLGTASQVISISWGAVAEKKDSLLDSVQRKCDKGKSQLTEDYRFESNLVRQYKHLSTILEVGLKAQRDLFDQQFETVRVALMSEDFIEQLKREASVVSQALRIEFYPDLSNSDGAAQKAAYNVGQFAEFVGKGGYAKVREAIEDLYKLGRGAVRDTAGVQIAIFKAADESLIDADVMGAKAINAFEDLVLEKNKRALELVVKEVDEVAELVRETQGATVAQKMGDDLDIDVQKVFQVFTTNTPADTSFCMDIFDRWQSGALKSLTPDQTRAIQKRLTAVNREVRSSVWSHLKSKLTARYTLLK